MINLSEQQIADAKASDLEATAAVIRETEDRVLQLAKRAATVGGRVNHDLMDECAQEGRIAVWECIERFEGTTVAQFFTFVDRTVQGRLTDVRKVETRQGVSRSAANDFERCLPMAGGDPYEAEKLACAPDSPLGKRRMTPDMALACRMAWQGVEHIDRPAFGAEEDTPGERAYRIEATYGVPGEDMTPADVENERKNGIRTAVRGTLAKMPGGQARVLRADYGIGDSAYYGDVVGGADAEMAHDFGVTMNAIKVARSKGKKTFAGLYVAGEFGALAS
ncbi:RNA polymerase sigma factor [Kitasatospora cathayae]|uniref:Sigma factor n=1 Tax=Kitasatospora cathayae TaxID=3004092 RepID=A0ABY7Q302_9ACTN|nr:sigma factor [Kitasatospora sp. HUAS 3-15]WBP87019.1 sigma factor [Kitasatospora sp. HUAS 3-15]